MSTFAKDRTTAESSSSFISQAVADYEHQFDVCIEIGASMKTTTRFSIFHKTEGTDQFLMIVDNDRGMFHSYVAPLESFVKVNAIHMHHFMKKGDVEYVVY